MKQEYEKPQLEIHGSVQELTHGGDPDALGDGAAFRGPFDESGPETGS